MAPGRGRVQPARTRYQRALNSAAFATLRQKKIIDTTPDDLRAVLADNKPSTNHFLRRMHNLAVGLGWLPWPIIPAKMWPAIQLKRKRGVTVEEHRRIITAEGDIERRHFYELLWEVGAAQTDAVMPATENIDWSRRVLSYERCKTGEWAYLIIGERLEELASNALGEVQQLIAQLTAPMLTSELKPKAGKYSLTLAPVEFPGLTMVLESSIDLLHWTPVFTHTNATTPVSRDFPLDQPQRFFRTRPGR